MSNVAVRRSSGARATACALSTVTKRVRPSLGRATRGQWSAGPRSAPDFIKPAHDTGKFAAAAQVRGITQTVGRAGPAALAGDQQSFKPHPLFARHVAERVRQSRRAAQARMRATKCLKADAPGNSTFSVTGQTVARSNNTFGRSARSADLCRSSTGRQPTGQAKADEETDKLAIVETGAGLPSMLPADPALATQYETSWVGDSELTRQITGHANRHLDRIIQELHNAELHRKAQPRVISAFDSGQFTVRVD